MIHVLTCPKCGGDLQTIVKSSNPPISLYTCWGCGWTEDFNGKREEVVRVPFDDRNKDLTDGIDVATNNSCIYCHRKPKFFPDGFFCVSDNEVILESGGWTALYMGVDRHGRVKITASGDDRVDYYPKFCPECGRKLEE